MWETNCKETLSDGVAQEFAIQYVSVSHEGPGSGDINMGLSNLCNVEWQFREWKRRAPDPRHEALKQVTREEQRCSYVVSLRIYFSNDRIKTHFVGIIIIIVGFIFTVIRIAYNHIII